MSQVLRYLIIGLCLFLNALSLPGQTDNWCGSLQREHGPYDYTNAQHRNQYLGVVERVHFTADVRSLRKGGATGSLVRDIEYVLNWFPNHHAALDVMARLAIREGVPQPRDAKWPIECRFQWATQVNPKDAVVPMIQGIYYHKLGKEVEALRYLERAIELDPDNPETHYNLGLILFQLGDYRAARDHARRAYRLGYPLMGLRSMLERTDYPLDD